MYILVYVRHRRICFIDSICIIGQLEILVMSYNKMVAVADSLAKVRMQ